VVLANPPFMTPTGGIRPHRRFGISSNRAEVLFVDYIMEHLTPKGRAGIVVPEGIIFQSGKAYKSLRRMMVEKYLVGVISLPSGVFNPYSGVKTSILVLDRELSQKTDGIFFAKVEKDGYDLGAQRREIEKNDLPIIQQEVKEYLDALRNGKEVESKKLTYVPKELILKASDIGLSYDRYTKKETIDSFYPEIKLGEVINFERGLVYSKNDEIENDGVGVLRANNIDSSTGKLNLTDIKKIRFNTKFKERQKLRKNDIFICVASGSKDHIGKVCFIDEDIDYYFGGFMGVIRVKESINPKYLFYLLRHNRFNGYLRNRIVGASINNLNSTILNEFNLPLPPIEVQEEIVRELEQYQKIIDGAKQVVDNYKPVIDIDPSWEIKELGEVCDVIAGQSPKGENYNEKGEGLPFYQGRTDFGDTYLLKTKKYTSQITKISKLGDVVMSVRAPVGPVNLTPFDICIGRGLCAIRPKENIVLNYIFYYLMSHQEIIIGNSGAIFDSINREQIEKLMISIPILEIQQSIVERIEGERQIIEGNKKLIEIYTQKIQDRINKIWGN
jgi:type I restriction enzyme M protein